MIDLIILAGFVAILVFLIVWAGGEMDITRWG